jgi:GAF domain-containing protein
VWDWNESPAALMHRADLALYADKATARRHVLSDPARLAAIHATGLLDGGAQPELDRIASTAAWLLGAPVAAVTLVTDERQTFAGQCGLSGWPAEAGGTPISYSYCQHAVVADAPLVIEDAREHPLVQDSDGLNEFGLISYAGVPLTGDDGLTLGVLCVADTTPRHWSPDQMATLDALAHRALAELKAAAA